MFMFFFEIDLEYFGVFCVLSTKFRDGVCLIFSKYIKFRNFRIIVCEENYYRFQCNLIIF